MKTIILSAAVAIAVPAAAAQFDTTRLFTHGAWQVEHTYDTTDGQVWCSAETSNGVGQVFSMTAYDNGGVVVIVMDSRWSASARPVRFRIDIDYEPVDDRREGRRDRGIGVPELRRERREVHHRAGPGHDRGGLQRGRHAPGSVLP